VQHGGEQQHPDRPAPVRGPRAVRPERAEGQGVRPGDQAGGRVRPAGVADEQQQREAGHAEAEPADDAGRERDGGPVSAQDGLVPRQDRHVQPR
jgi:hypothetical protein